MKLLLIVSTIIVLAVGQIQFYSPPASVPVMRGTNLRFKWATGSYNGTGYQCPNQVGVAGTQLAEFEAACDVTGTSQTSALTLYNQIYSWAVTNTKTMEDPLVKSIGWANFYVRNVTRANLTTHQLQFIADQFPLFPRGDLPSLVLSLTDFTGLYPLGTTTYPYAQAKLDVFQTLQGCVPFARSNATDIMHIYMEYLTALVYGNNFILTTFNDYQYPAYAPYYSNITYWYNNVLSPNSNALLTYYGIDTTTFPQPGSPPSIDFGSQPSYIEFDLGTCASNALDLSINPVTIEVFTGTDINHNTSQIVVLAENAVNTGSMAYQLPCDNNAESFVFFRVSTATQSGYIQLTATPCSAAALSIGLVIYALAAIVTILL